MEGLEEEDVEHAHCFRSNTPWLDKAAIYQRFSIDFIFTMFLQTFFLRRPSCNAQWEVGSAKPSIHRKGAFISNGSGDDNKNVKKKKQKKQKKKKRETGLGICLYLIKTRTKFSNLIGYQLS